MVTKRSTTTLLSKFTHLFRKPGNEEADSSIAATSESAAEARDSLQQLFKRKRRNDAMRVYELNQLRTIIRDGRGIRPYNLTESVTAATQTRNSGMGSLERTSILDKIDGAEAHLEQWWGSGSRQAALAANPMAPNKVASGAEPNDDDLDLDFTGMQDLSDETLPSRYPASGPVPFTGDDRAMTPVENGLRDAALLYAEGEFAAAQSTLSNLLFDPGLDTESRELLTFSLLDVYRCAGQQENFEALALEYADHFGRSPPEWFSILDEAPGDAPTKASATAQDPGMQSGWRCPPILDTHALADCVTHEPPGSGVSSINWLGLQHIDAAIAKEFAKQLDVWFDQPMKLQWLGVESLVDAIHMCRITGKVPENEPWWLIQMDMHCLLQEPQMFEDLALEYCVAFEVSPPNWRVTACKLAHNDTVPEAIEFVSTLPSQSSETESQPETASSIYQLCGNVLGDSPVALHKLQSLVCQKKQITVSCARLGRVDINAAGRLLHWAQENHANGCSVQFIFLPRLVLVYFYMLGMERLASLSAGSH